MWHVSRRGIFGLFVAVIGGIFHFLLSMGASGATLSTDLNISNPIWMFFIWLFLGVVFFLWAGWYFPKLERERRTEHGSAFAVTSEM